ncbi:acetolactate synthase large subunit [Myxococcus sp. MISCRS1]|jgi:acetolactate synthase-1/2/3 large subunit|uniref:Acetolactate synthase n=1 Tax=Myxococcus fulvus TaxID=33 RepID=A0A511T7K1_MYXFU|nr:MULTISPECIES: acetolactate synthase large subunit [Myxococcus]MBZ4400131.1 acetolactate synthase large subunit [Myxococcus sp. AS-1-15]MCY0996185.1 acetolactate synthase large subunit [Myxococcus sp. MISCRS1]GEN09583.1 acetolactate synthase [Myxococcus fulvus]SEU33135.1 acetolactate synthase-1/2/3 large subunit [Myxococcus fulvus]
MKASDLFVKALEAEGVRYVFGLPGEENLDLLESMRGSSLKLVLTRHEQAAGFMAATWGRLTGKAGVTLATLGPGATNLVTPAAYAQLGAMPMVMLTGQKPIKASKQGHFQIVDVVGMMRPLTKLTRTLVSAEHVPSAVREAFRRAEEERPGATHLELPEDVAREATEAPLLAPSAWRRPVADEGSIARAVETIASARRPLLMVGAGANRKLTSEMLRVLVDRVGIPFSSTQMGKGVVDESHPLWMGTAALSDGDFVHRAIEMSDCIINVGHDVIEKPPFVMRDSSRAVVHLNFSSAEVDPVYFPKLEVTGDIANAVWRIAEGLGQRGASWDFAPFEKARAGLEAQLARGAADDRFPIYPARLVAEVRRALPDDGIVCLDNGMYKLWFARYYRTRRPNTLLLDNALATMGAGLPSAIAAKLVHPRRKVVAVCGDGGFMMNSQELETAVRLGLDLTVVVVRDDGYGMIRWKQGEMGLPDFGMALGNPDFVRYAEAYGARGHRPTSASEFGSTLSRCLESGGVHVIDLPIDYSDNTRALGVGEKEGEVLHVG